MKPFKLVKNPPFGKELSAFGILCTGIQACVTHGTHAYAFDNAPDFKTFNATI
jgi:hypothetical protein